MSQQLLASTNLYFELVLLRCLTYVITLRLRWRIINFILKEIYHLNVFVVITMTYYSIVYDNHLLSRNSFLKNVVCIFLSKLLKKKCTIIFNFIFVVITIPHNCYFSFCIKFKQKNELFSFLWLAAIRKTIYV